MPHHARFLSALLAKAAAVCAALALAVQPVAAQSVLRDAETEALLRDMASPLVSAAGLDPKNVDVVLVNDSSINAFVVNGQTVFLHAGLINAADSANQVQGVIAHELGHITGGHAITGAEGGKAATNITLLSLLLGVAAAAAGAGDAAMGVIMAGQQAALGKYLAFSRAQESQADAAGASFLAKAGISGRGSVEFFKKLAGEAYRQGYAQSDMDTFMSTHPLEADRIATLQDSYEKDPAWNKPSDAALEARFRRAKAKLYGYLAEPKNTLLVYPLTDNSVPARYARAYAWHKDAFLDKSL
ncbi:MAG: M48 family metalloprotease, partial [Novosphingobium sp.]